MSGSSSRSSSTDAIEVCLLQRALAAEVALNQARLEMAQARPPSHLGRGGGSDGFADAKRIVDPRSFPGEADQMAERNFVVKAYLAAVPLAFRRRLRDAQSLGFKSADGNDTSEDMALLPRQHYVLVPLCMDQALDIIKWVHLRNGSEAWRRLRREYELSTGARFGMLLQSILRREFGTRSGFDLVREIYLFE